MSGAVGASSRGKTIKSGVSGKNCAPHPYPKPIVEQLGGESMGAEKGGSYRKTRLCKIFRQAFGVGENPIRAYPYSKNSIKFKFLEIEPPTIQKSELFTPTQPGKRKSCYFKMLKIGTEFAMGRDSLELGTLHSIRE